MSDCLFLHCCCCFVFLQSSHCQPIGWALFVSWRIIQVDIKQTLRQSKEPGERLRSDDKCDDWCWDLSWVGRVSGVLPDCCCWLLLLVCRCRHIDTARPASQHQSLSSGLYLPAWRAGGWLTEHLNISSVIIISYQSLSFSYRSDSGLITPRSPAWYDELIITRPLSHPR